MCRGRVCGGVRGLTHLPGPLLTPKSQTPPLMPLLCICRCRHVCAVCGDTRGDAHLPRIPLLPSRPRPCPSHLCFANAGAAMFVQCVVTSVVVRTSHAAPCYPSTPCRLFFAGAPCLCSAWWRQRSCASPRPLATLRFPPPAPHSPMCRRRHVCAVRGGIRGHPHLPRSPLLPFRPRPCP